MSHLYVLDQEDNPLAIDDVVVWARWFEDAGKRRIVAQTEKDGVLVSTIFLGIDHRFMRNVGEPILWETMVFGGKHDQEMERYTSLEEAVNGHISKCMLIWGRP